MFESQGFKVFTAAAIGAFIGATLALQCHWFLAIGMIIGGIVGLAYQPVEVVRAIPRAASVAGLSSWSWMRRNHQCLGMAGLQFLITFSWAGITGMILWALHPHLSADLVGLSCVAGMVYVLILLLGHDILRYEDWSFTSRAKTICRNTNPATLLFWHLPRLVIWLVPRVIKFFGAFFLLIHSDLRLLCGIDAALGTAAGYFAHNAFAGGVIGGLIGLLNYELISKRWLKLVPAR